MREGSERWHVNTVEGVGIRYHLADLPSRGAAFALDLAIILTAAGLLLEGAGQLPHGVRPTAAGLSGLLSFAIFVGYFVVLEGLAGETVGKRLLGIRVLRQDGGACGWTPSILRNVMLILDVLPGFCAVAMITILATRRRQRLGDLTAGTVVVAVPRLKRRTRMSLEPSPHWPLGRNEVRPYLDRLGPVLDRAEQFWERRGNMVREASDRVAQALAEEAHAILGGPEAAAPLPYLGHLLFLREELRLPPDALRLLEDLPMSDSDASAIREAAAGRGRRAQKRQQALLNAWRNLPGLLDTPAEELWLILVHRAWREKA